jgi:hypothetical protein
LPFLGITAHWISEDWELKNLLLDFIKLEGPHSGDNIAEGFLKSLSEYNLLNKVSYILYSNKQIHLFIKFFK